MTFNVQNFVRQSVGLNTGAIAGLTPSGSSFTAGGAALFSYTNLADTIATIVAANYFSNVAYDCSVNDIFFVTGSDSSGMYQVSAVDTTVNPPTISVVSYGSNGSIGTANIQNNAVTYAKMQQASAGHVLLANPTGSAANYEEVTLANGLDFSGTTLEVSLNVIRYASVAMTLANFTGMYATPFQILAAPGAGLMHVINSCAINMVYGSAPLAAGGAVGLQYGNTAHLAGSAASATEAATDFTGVSASSMFRFSGGLSTGISTSAAINTAVYISNDTAAFTTGTGASFTVNVWYSTVSAS